jgi:hypothetical protein
MISMIHPAEPATNDRHRPPRQQGGDWTRPTPAAAAVRVQAPLRMLRAIARGSE